MDYLIIMEDNGVTLGEKDKRFILQRFRSIPERLHRELVFGYIETYHQELQKLNPKNEARFLIARHYANRFLKLYRVNWNE